MEQTMASPVVLGWTFDDFDPMFEIVAPKR
jgi:hypothetical protein